MAVVTILVCAILFSNGLCDIGTYNYPKPYPPVQFEEPSTPISYLPPELPPVIPDFPDVIPELPPVPVPIPTYLPATQYPPIATPPDIFTDDDTIVVPAPPLYQQPQSKMRIISMSCVMDDTFKSLIHISGGGASLAPPVIDDGSEGCITRTTSGTFLVNLEGNKRMGECGVKRCSLRNSPRSNMCMVVRLPTVRGLKLPEDELVTLQCVPQDTVVSHTKHIRLGPTSVNVRGRSANSAVASGGGQRNFESKMLLLRKSPGSSNFDQPLHSGSIVLLGEEVILRATVQDGDGWKSSRIGPVIIRSGNTQKSTTLIGENGCRSPGMQSICPFQPRQLTPLDNVLHFRAFLFQDSTKGDDMILSVRMMGCLNAQDCFQNGVCDATNLHQSRTKRHLNGDGVEGMNYTTNWESQIQFRVQIPEDSTKLPRNVENAISVELLLVISMLILCLGLFCCLIFAYCKQKILY